MAQQGQLHPTVLAAELKVVLKAGARAAYLVRHLDVLPVLRLAVAPDADDPYEVAVAIERAVAEAIQSMGDGPYGQATSALFGVRPSSRGLLLKLRRREAASILDVEVSTLRRHYEDPILLDVSFGIWGQFQRS